MKRIANCLTRTMFICGVGIALQTNAAGLKEPDTVGSLPERTFDVRPDQSITDGSTRAWQNYQQFLEVSGEDEMTRPEAMRRLADLRLEAGELASANLSNVGMPNADILAAIASYNKILDDYPNYSRRDEILYQLARAYDSEQKFDETLITLEKLAKNYPNSHFYPEAQFRRGEIYFTLERFYDAEKAYAAVIAAGATSEFYEQSLYKHGWVRFKRGEYVESLESFATLLDYCIGNYEDSNEALNQLTRPQRVLVEDSLRIAGVVFSFDEGVTGIEDFEARQGKKKYEFLLYDALGDMYIDQERWSDAANTYLAFSRLSPDHIAAPRLMLSAIDAYRRGKFAALLLESKKGYVELYSPNSLFWRQHPLLLGGPEYLEVKNSVKELAGHYHAEGLKSKKSSDFAEAASWYRRFLEAFPSESDTVQTNYNFAASLFEARQYDEAIREYHKVAYELPAGELSADAGFNAVIAFTKREEELSGEAKAAVHEALLLESIKFAQQFDAHPQAEAVLARAMIGWFEFKRYTEASAAAELLLSRGENIKLAERQNALAIIAKTYLEQQEFRKAENKYLELLDILPESDKRYKESREALAAAIYQQAAESQSAGRDDEALSAFQRVALIAPKSSIRETSDYDTTTILFQQKAWPKAIEALEKFRADFPRSDRQQEITRRLADAYVADSRWQLAAQEYERISMTSGTDRNAQLAAIVYANEYYEKANDMDSLRRGLELILKRFDDQFDQAMEARQKLADFAKQKGDGKTRNRLLNDIVKADREAGDARTTRSRSLAAHAALELVAPVHKEFASVELNITKPKSIEAKTKALKSAKESIEALKTYNIADVTTEANYQIAGLYRQLAKEFNDSPRPKGLPDDALEQYNLTIFEKAIAPNDDAAVKLYMINGELAAKGYSDDSARASIAAIYQMAEMYRQLAKELEVKAEEDVLVEERLSKYEEQSIKIHMANVALASKGVYDDSVRGSYAALAVLNPARFAKAEQQLDFFEYPVESSEVGRQPIITTLANANVAAAINDARVLDAASAAESLKKISTEFPEDKLAQVNYGIALVKLGRYEDAKVLLSECCAATDELLRANAAIGVAQSERGLGHFAESRSAYEQALNINPNDIVAHLNLGVLLDLYIQEPTSALQHYERALELSSPADSVLTKWVKELKQRIAPTARVESESIIEGLDVVESPGQQSNSQQVETLEEMP